MQRSRAVKHKGPRRGHIIPALFACFCAGGVGGWLLHDAGDRLARLTPATAVADQPVRDRPDSTETIGPAPDRRSPIATTGHSDSIAELDRHHLRMPIDGARIEAMSGQFGESREGGSRGHEAVDMLAPRGTPVRAVEGGTIAKLFVSKAGGNTVYQFDPSGRFCYYYAHLQRYADGLHEGREIAAGDVIGYVGTSGNAPANTPHLHFAVFELAPGQRWWEGRPIDPYLVFKDRG